MLSNMTVTPKSLLDFQVYLEENPGLPDQLSGFAFAVHRDSSTLTSPAALKDYIATSASALSDIIATMYSSVSTHWSIASLVGPLLPAGFLVPVRGKLATDPTFVTPSLQLSWAPRRTITQPTLPILWVSLARRCSLAVMIWTAPLLPTVPCQSTLSPTTIVA